MKTKQIPPMVTLVAGLITCVMAVFNHISMATFVKNLFIVVISFFILGTVIKVIIDKNFKEMDEEIEEELEEELEGEQQEEEIEE